jgi:HrpA-like RNA helicase
VKPRIEFPSPYPPSSNTTPSSALASTVAALLGEDGAPARVIIASAIAESSITIRSVTHVIDACRACEIHWTPASGEASPQIVWVSQAQAKQRAGRTGRTNHGTVWQLVPSSLYHGFPEFEVAALQLQLLRKEVLLLTCSSSKLLKDAGKLLASCLDPPKTDVVARAEEWLLANKLVERQPLGTKRGSAPSLRPTRLGELLDTMPVDLDSAKLVLLGATVGLLDEAVIMAVLRSCQPMALKREVCRTLSLSLIR